MNSSYQLVFNCITTKYFQFKGRASRKEFWLFTICTILLNCIPELNHYVFKDNTYSSIVLSTVVYPFFSIFLIIPSFAVVSRRLHDINISGWWQLFFIIPTSIGIVKCGTSKTCYSISALFFMIFIIMLFLKGTPVTNRYGSPPEK